MITLICSLCFYKKKQYYIHVGEICPQCKKGTLKEEAVHLLGKYVN
jgi:predicted Zn-ribbon and HTH transcriptional regulator